MGYPLKEYLLDLYSRSNPFLQHNHPHKIIAHHSCTNLHLPAPLAHAGTRQSSARSTAALVMGTLWPFLASGWAWATARAPAWVATAADGEVPRSICSTSVRRHGMGATPPSTTLAVRIRVSSICSITATLTSA